MDFEKVLLSQTEILASAISQRSKGECPYLAFSATGNKKTNKHHSMRWGGKIANTHKGSAKQISTHKPICIHPTQPHPIRNESDRELPAYLPWKMVRVTHTLAIIASVCGITAGCALRLKEMGLKWVQNQNGGSLYFSLRPCWEKGTAFQIVAFIDIYVGFCSSLLRLHPHTSMPQVCLYKNTGQQNLA